MIEANKAGVRSHELMKTDLWKDRSQRFHGPNFGDKKPGGCHVLVFLVLKGGLELFCLKICDVLAQQGEFSTTLRSHLVVC